LKYSDHWYFDENGKVMRYELFPEMVQAIYDAVGDLQEVALLLGGGALIEDHAVIKKDAGAHIEELLSDHCESDEGDVTTTKSTTSNSNSSTPSSSSSPQLTAMAIEFLLA